MFRLNVPTLISQIAAQDTFGSGWGNRRYLWDSCSDSAYFFILPVTCSAYCLVVEKRFNHYSNRRGRSCISVDEYCLFPLTGRVGLPAAAGLGFVAWLDVTLTQELCWPQVVVREVLGGLFVVSKLVVIGVGQE